MRISFVFALLFSVVSVLFAQADSAYDKAVIISPDSGARVPFVGANAKVTVKFRTCGLGYDKTMGGWQPGYTSIYCDIQGSSMSQSSFFRLDTTSPPRCLTTDSISVPIILASGVTFTPGQEMTVTIYLSIARTLSPNNQVSADWVTKITLYRPQVGVSPQVLTCPLYVSRDKVRGAITKSPQKNILNILGRTGPSRAWMYALITR